MAPVTSSFVLSPIAELLLPAHAVLQRTGLTELPLCKSITSVELPEVQCSFPSQTIHPDYLQLKQLSQEWLLSRFGEMLLLDGAGQGGGFAESVALKSRFDILVTLSYANGLSSRMPAIIKFMAWLHMVDNLLDEPQEMAADSSAAALLGARIMAVLEDRDDEESAAAVAAGSSSSQLSARGRLAIRLIEESAREVWSDLRSGMPVGQQRRFVGTFRDFLGATATQVGYRQSGRLADVEEYKRLRRDSSCWRACDVLIEYALGIELDERTLAHPLLLRLRDATLYHICWLNDLLSFEKEYKDGDFFNLVSILYYNRLKESLDAATAAASGSSAAAAAHVVVTPPILHQIMLDVAQLVKDMDEECVRLVRDIRSGTDSSLQVSDELDAYIQSLTYWLGGNLSFHFAGMRHGLYTASYASKNLLARLPDALAHKLELSTCEAIVAATATPHLAHLQLPAAQAA